LLGLPLILRCATGVGADDDRWRCSSVIEGAQIRARSGR